MIVELIRDKRKIVDRISHSQIDEFVSLLQSSQVRFNYFQTNGMFYKATYNSQDGQLYILRGQML